MEHLNYTDYIPAEGQEIDFWIPVGNSEDIPDEGGACFKYGDIQLAIFNFAHRKAWYACQNLCPHKKQMILSRGITGSEEGTPKVACPFHKKTFSLETGECLNGDECSIATFPVKEENGKIFVGLAEKISVSTSNV